MRCIKSMKPAGRYAGVEVKDYRDMAKKFPIKPAHPERICWGCDKYCPVDAMACGNGSVATPHPSELFGDDWMEWGLDAGKAGDEPATPAAEGSPGSAGSTT